MVLVLIFFLFEWRTALISLIAIPLSLMAALMVLYLRGDTINTMILAGLVIAVGVVVDDAIIDVENIWRRLRQRGDGTGRLAPRIILEASLEVRTAIFYATLINVLAVVPVFFLESVTGSFFEPLALSYALAILVSMVVALTVTPALSLLLLSKTRERRDAPLVRVLKRGYRALLAAHRPQAVARNRRGGTARVRRRSRSCRASGRSCIRRSRSGTSSRTGRPRPARPAPRRSES